MASYHNQLLCMGKNKFSQDDLRHGRKPCIKCKVMLEPQDVFDCIPLIDCVSLIKVKKNSNLRNLFSS